VPNNCIYQCIGSTCSACNPGSTQCASTTQVQTCGSNGQWGPASTCANGCTGGACSVGGGTKSVFITSAAYSGNMGGLTGADAKCQMHATNAGLSGTFMAWLGDSTNGPANRFTKAGGPFVLAKRGITVANNWAELASDTHQHALDSDENGSTSLPLGTGTCASSTGGHQFWSNTYVDGTKWMGYGSCSDWTSTANTGEEVVGRTDLATAGWYLWCHGGGVTCGAVNPLFCVQQ
jgi:hypothetical protein